MARKAERLLTLAEAARRLGCHVETLRLRVRRGELAAKRGAHGTYLIREAAFAHITPPVRSRRRAFSLADLEWSWLALGYVANADGAGFRDLQVIGLIRRRPKLSKSLARLFDVHRLRLAELTTAEIADITGLSTRHVRRLSRRRLVAALVNGTTSAGADEGSDETGEFAGLGAAAADALAEKMRRQADRQARRVVARLQARMEAAGLRYHRRPPRPDDVFVSPVPLRAFRARDFDRETVRRLLDSGLTDVEVKAIQRVGIGTDELNELMLHGLPAAARRKEAGLEPAKDD